MYGAEHPGEVASLLRMKGATTIALGITLEENQARELDVVSGSTDRTFMAKTFEDLLTPEFVEKVGMAVCYA